jgi:hypothetical protein
MAKPDFMTSPHTHTRTQRLSNAHAQSYRDLYGERVRTPRPSPLRRALGDLLYLVLGALAIGGWVGMIVLALDQWGL